MIFDVFMLNNELDMLECRLLEMQDYDVTHILAEANVTHCGVSKPLHYLENEARFAPWKDRIRSTSWFPETMRQISEPWAREHYQRDLALPYLAAAGPDDPVLICDVDEIPSRILLNYLAAGQLPDVRSVQMRTTLFAVDWEVSVPVPPACVVATAGWLAGKSLAKTRDLRETYPVFPSGGWHLSWTGGPEKQREKLETASCHRPEIDARPEGKMIRDGTRYRTSESGGGLPVVPIEIDATMPRYVRERRCPENWFRPQEAL